LRWDKYKYKKAGIACFFYIIAKRHAAAISEISDSAAKKS